MKRNRWHFSLQWKSKGAIDGESGDNELANEKWDESVGNQRKINILGSVVWKAAKRSIRKTETWHIAAAGCDCRRLNHSVQHTLTTPKTTADMWSVNSTNSLPSKYQIQEVGRSSSSSSPQGQHGMHSSVVTPLHNLLVCCSWSIRYRVTYLYLQVTANHHDVLYC